MIIIIIPLIWITKPRQGGWRERCRRGRALIQDSFVV